MILRENLSRETAYMLRDDGKLFKLNGAHPYIWGSGANDLYTLFKDNLDDLVWIYNYTENDFTKELMSDLIKYVVEYGKEDDILPENYNIDYLKNEFSDIDFSVPVIIESLKLSKLFNLKPCQICEILLNNRHTIIIHESFVVNWRIIVFLFKHKSSPQNYSIIINI